MRNAAQIVLPVLVPRAILIWILARLIFAVLPLAGGTALGSLSPSPVGVILAAGAIGMVDTHVRKEWVLWGNLGIPRSAVFVVYVLAAIPGEIVMALT